jgi:hypothetical protein
MAEEEKFPEISPDTEDEGAVPLESAPRKRRKKRRPQNNEPSSAAAEMDDGSATVNQVELAVAGEQAQDTSVDVPETPGSSGPRKRHVRQKSVRTGILHRLFR